MDLGITLTVNDYWGVLALALLAPMGAKVVLELFKKGPPDGRE